jgi:type IV fimbrial biogenesis protein FimT
VSTSTLRKLRGFTLVELLITLTVLVITLAIAAPAMSGFVRSSQLSGTQTELIGALMLARSEATKRGSQVGVVAATPASGAEFSNGWTIWVDANSNGVFDAGETVVREYAARKNSVKISTQGGETVAAFKPTGFASTTLTFKICGTVAPTRGYSVSLAQVGLTDVKEIKPCP